MDPMLIMESRMVRTAENEDRVDGDVVKLGRMEDHAGKLTRANHFPPNHPAISRKSVQLPARPSVLAQCNTSQQHQDDDPKPHRPLGRTGGLFGRTE